MHSPHHPEPQYTISPPVISSAALAVLGTFAIVHALDLLGYPASRWLSKMASELSPRQILRLLPAPPSPKSDADADSSPTSMARATGLLSKGFRSVTGALATTYKQVPAGLGNWDNSCYQNSVIQGLASLPSLGNFLSQASSAYRTLGEDSTSFALADLLQKLNDPENHGRQFWIRGKLKTMSTIQQQDAQEYYSMVLDALDKEITEASKSQRRASLKLDASVVDEPSQDTQEASETESDSEQCKEIVETKEPCTEEHPILSPNPLDGLLAQRVSCTQCGYSEGLSLIPFNCLTVPLGKGWAYDIRDCLDDFTHLEYIEGVECGKCTVLKTVRTLSALTFPPDSVLAGRLRAAEEILEENNFDDKNIIQKTKILKKNWVKVKKSRQAVVARAPKSLIIHVNRSVFDEMTGDMYKNNARVQYPRILDLAAWCLGSRPSETQKPDHEVEETWSKNPNKSMIERKHTADSSTPSPFQYALKAAVTHWGSHGNGHYVCYRQHAFKVRDPEAQEEGREVPDGSDEPQWWRLSDESVNEVSEEEALHQSNAYMLFYERLD
ncbi:cysteine proteinase, partial [Sporormia fimetaria CBS 119925]